MTRKINYQPPIDKPIKPYYRKGNKYFYRKGKLRMVVERTDIGKYIATGDFIDGLIEFPEIEFIESLK